MTSNNRDCIEELFKLEVIKDIVSGLPGWVANLNAEDCEEQAGHQSEMVIQRQIAIRLKTWFPSAKLVRQNKMLVKKDGRTYIPDIIIDNIGGDCWAIFELKTLLNTDQLQIADIREDLQKLCEYETCHPNALCLFMLVASESKLTNSRRQTSWSDLPISIDGDLFLSPTPRPQLINKTHVAIPWVSSTIPPYAFVYVWLVRHKDRVDAPRVGSYQYWARMHKQ